MTRTTVGYVVLFCVLAVLSVVKGTLPEGPAPIAFKLPALKADEISKIVVTRGDQSVTLERGSGGPFPWMITAPLSYPADSGAIDGILKAFEKEIPMDLKMTADEKDHERYEVNAEKAVKLELFKGAELETAFLLGKNAAGGSVYLRPVNSADVFRAKVTSRARLEKPAADWREKKIFDVKKEVISKLEVVADGATRIFTQANGVWAAEQPAGLQVDQMTVDGMARSISTFRSADILEKAEGETGLSAPTMKISMTLPDGTRSLLIGAEKSSGEFYAQREGDPQLFTVRDGSLKTLKKTDAELRDKSVFTFDPEQVNEITVSRSEKRVKLKLQDGGWKVAEPPGVAVDSKAVQGMMASIATLRAAGFAPGVNASTAGFDSAPLEVAFGLKEGQAVGLTVGGAAESGLVYAVRKGNPEVLTLRETSISNFKRILGEPVPKGPEAGAGGMMGGMPGGMQLPPGFKLPPGLQ